MSIFEPEETIGIYWHRMIGGASTYRHYPQAAVSLDALRRRLAILFHALGGSGAVRISAGAPFDTGHRLSLKQRIGLGRERIEHAVLDTSTLRLPTSIDIFPTRSDNEALYEWLAAWFAHAVPPTAISSDPLQSDIVRLRACLATTEATITAWPGLRPIYRRLTGELISAWPQRSLPRTEAAIDASIQTLLDGAPRPATDAELLRAIRDPTVPLENIRAPRGYRRFLPVPLWGDLQVDAEGTQHDDIDEGTGISAPVDNRRRHASRRETDRSQRDDPLLLHRFETIFSLSDMVNVNRPVEDDDEDLARQAADDLNDLTIGSNQKRASTRLKLDLDLAPPATEDGAIVADITYPEWDWRRGSYRPDYCRVVAGMASEEGEDWAPDATMQRCIKQVRRQFEALRPKRQTFYSQPDGDELDLTALVQDVANRQAGAPATERIFLQARSAARDVSLAVLLDVSLSTDAWLQDCRVLDVEKGALLALTHGLAACGDEHAIFTFTSRRRHWVNVQTVKDFGEDVGPRVSRRIQALKPGQYTRIGAAIRHVSIALQERPQRHRLLLVITDGKPNDIDHYEGRYGIEDTRLAIREAHRAGLRVFGVTVDEQARDYFPYIFGRGAYAIFPNISRLPTALPAIYRQITK